MGRRIEGQRSRWIDGRGAQVTTGGSRQLRKLLPLIGVFVATAFALVGAGSAGAATTVLSQDFESGLGAWTASGFWHVQNNPQTISVNPLINPTLVTLPDSGALPAAYQGINVAWFGEASTGTYCGADSISSTNDPNQTSNNGCTSYDASGNTTNETGDLISPPFSLAGVTSPQLSFASWWEIEAIDPQGYDIMEVDYSLDGGTTWTSLGNLNPTNPTPGTSDQDYTNNGLEVPATWQLYSFDLSALAGKPNVMLRFHFDTFDDLYNGFRGWLLDSIAVTGNSTTTSPTPGLPTVASGTAAPLSSTAASFTGTVNPDGLSTSAVFQYGLDPSYFGGGPVTYTNQVTASPSPVGSDFSNHSVSASATGLVPNALYHVRLVASNGGGTTFGPDQTFRTNSAGAPGRPVLGKSFNATPVSGQVYVRLPGSSSGSLAAHALVSHATSIGSGFVPLTQARNLPTGTQVDTRYGTIKIVTATGNKGKRAKKLQNGSFNGGLFSVKQARSGRNKGLVTLKLLEGVVPGSSSYGSCKTKTTREGPVARVAVSGSVLSTLRSRSHGRYSSSGHYGSATSRGTAWTITDRCNGTLITVQQDTVVVHDFVNHKTFTLHRGQHFLIKPKRK